MTDGEIAAAMAARAAAAAARWGSTGATAAVDAFEEFNVEEYQLARRRLLLTKAQAAELLTVSVRTLTRLVADRQITPTRIGGAIRFAPAELEAFVIRSTQPKLRRRR